MLPPREALPKALAAARKALAIDDNLGEAHGSLAHALMHQWKLGPARDEFRRALALNPNDKSIYFAWGEYLADVGKEDEAVTELKRALRIEPMSTELLFMLDWPLYLKADYREQLNTAYRVIKTDPDFWLGHMEARSALERMRRFPEALEELNRARILNPLSSFNLSVLGLALAHWGNVQKPFGCWTI